MAEQRHLVVIRGNSATGKTTLARNLQLALGRGTANIGQDHFRRVILREHDIPDGANITLIEHTVKECLALGWHVVLEGILVEDHYGAMLRRLIAEHRGSAHAFYLDLPLQETIRRHGRRPLACEVPAEALRRWYRDRDLLGVPGEQVLDATATVDELTRAILQRMGPITPRPEDVGGQFLL